jgi:hypothetical protein
MFFDGMWRAPVIFVLLIVAFALIAPPRQAATDPSSRADQQIQPGQNTTVAVEQALKPANITTAARPERTIVAPIFAPN